MHKLTLKQLLQKLTNKETSPKEVTDYFLKRIKEKNKKLNSLITIDESAACDLETDKSNTPLKGIPILHKDIFCTQGMKTSCGSKMLDNFIPPYSATLVEKLKSAGAICIGKTNMDEFAMGSSNETSFYGPVSNPWDLNTVPGGSSGGSAAAVAARIIPAATGTDTGGSIRQPAAFCGISGIKPTYGRVSRFGMIAFASSLDQAGPMAQTAEDCAILLNHMAGHDPADSTSHNISVPDYTASLENKLDNLKIGIPKEFFDDNLDTNLQPIIEQALSELEKLGAKLKPISLPNISLAIPAYYVLAPAECSANLARYDGVRYGYRCNNPIDLNDLYKRTRAEAFGDEVKRRILIGTYVLSAGFYDAYYIKAQKIRRIMTQDYIKAFKDVDVIASSATPTTAFLKQDKTTNANKHQNPVTMYKSDVFTSSVNLAGLPGLSVPCGFYKNLPVGLQLIGNYFEEAKILNVAHKYQQATDWHTKIPSEFAD